MKKIEYVLRTANITFGTAQPRATICSISFLYNCTFGHVYGVAIRTKTDQEDPEIGKKLAYHRATKALHKAVAVIDRTGRRSCSDKAMKIRI